MFLFPSTVTSLQGLVQRVVIKLVKSDFGSNCGGRDSAVTLAEKGGGLTTGRSRCCPAALRNAAIPDRWAALESQSQVYKEAR